jgi:hypothetical protein
MTGVETGTGGGAGGAGTGAGVRVWIGAAGTEIGGLVEIEEIIGEKEWERGRKRGW